MADISSLRPNIVLELGYALKAQHESRVAIFISKNISVPADLSGKKRLEYSGFSDFQAQLINWLVQVVKIDKKLFEGFSAPSVNFHDEFQDFDRFLDLWSIPPGCDFNLTSEGLRFTNAHLPILSRTLGLLVNFEFTFTARIQRGAIGWVIKGAKDFTSYFPPFCVMFNTTLDHITPHILHLGKPDPYSLYHRFDPVTANLQATKQGWFTITTRCVDDTITIINDNKELFQANFATDAPYADLYQDFQPKQGQIGFRCHPDEEAIVRSVEVREI